MDVVIVCVGYKDMIVVVICDFGGGEVFVVLVVGWIFKCKFEFVIVIKNDNLFGIYWGFVCYVNVIVDVFSNFVRFGEKLFVVFKFKNFFEF